MRKTIYCTLDTETVGGASTPTGMYNLGCVIHDNQGNIFATTSMLVMEHYDKIKNDGYAKKTFQSMKRDFAKAKCLRLPLKRKPLPL